ncbi:MAG TPA: hypothetical protein VNJ46_04425 [Gaiellaceae bacterium]|nr:hypothetical protein [Gaiellaceae bacterium]
MDASTDTGSAGRHAPGALRLGALGGIAFAAVLLAGVFAAPMPPQPGDAPSAIRSYYVEHADAVRVAASAQALAAVFFLLFVCALARSLERGGAASIAPAATLGTGVLALAATLAGTAAFGTLGFGVAEDADPDLVRALFDLGNMALNVGDPVLAAFVGVPSFVALRERVLPRWIALFGLAVAVGWAVAGVSILVREGPFAGPNGAYGMTVVVVFLVWVVATSAALYRREG